MIFHPTGARRGAGDDDWVAAVRAFVAVAQRAAIVPEPTPPVSPEMPPLQPADSPPEIEDPSPHVPPAPVQDPPAAPPLMGGRRPRRIDPR